MYVLSAVCELSFLKRVFYIRRDPRLLIRINNHSFHWNGRVHAKGNVVRNDRSMFI